MANNNRPVEPVGHTCPMIDEIIEFINENVAKSIDTSGAMWTLEKIREANGKLRDWGNQMRNEAHYLDIGIGNCIHCGGEMFEEAGTWYHHSQKILPISERYNTHLKMEKPH